MVPAINAAGQFENTSSVESTQDFFVGTDVTQSNIYTVHNIYPLMEPTVMPALHEGGRHGVRWHFARPPVLGIEFEMDLRGVQREITVSG